MNISSLTKDAGEWARDFFPKRKQNTLYVIGHMSEELGEVFKAWRTGDIEPHIKLKEGLEHPEGLGSELADVIILAAIVAFREEIDLDEALDLKMKYHMKRLARKLKEREKD